MRILAYTENHDPGGGNRYLTDFLASLPAGTETVLCFNNGAVFPEDLARLSTRVTLRDLPIRSEGQRLRQLGRSHWLVPLLLFWKLASHTVVLRSAFIRYRARRNKALLRKVVQESAFSLAIAFNGGFPAALSCFDFLGETRAAGIPSLMCVVSMPTPVSFRDSLYDRIIHGIDGFIVNCKAIKNALFSTRGIPLEKIHVLYNTVPIDAQGIPPAAGSPGKTVRFGFIGRTEAAKGIFLLIDAFAGALRTCPGIRLLVFGRVYGRSTLRKAIVQAGCVGAVEIRGRFDGSVFDVLAGIEVFVLPSLWEGFPYVILEAMAAGVAVIATDVGGVSEIVSADATGILVPARDPQALEAAIERLATDASLRKRLGESGRRKVRERFLPDSFARGVSVLLAKFGGDLE